MEQLVIFIAGVIFGVILVKLLSLQKAEDKIFSKKFEEEYDALKKQLVEEQNRVVDLNKQLTSLEVDNKNLLTSRQSEEEIEKKFLLEFQNIANKILKANTEDFSNTNKKELNTMLEPLKTKITEFEKKVEEKYINEAKERLSLERHIKDLYDRTQQIGQDANNLTNALKGQAKMQGNWGEMKLETILEMAGLQENREYSRQRRIKSGDGKILQPDIVLHLPHNKNIIIDAKVSLISYVGFSNSDDENEKERYLKDFFISLKNHIRDLSDKSYQNIDGIASLDYVLLFIPLESTFSLIIQKDSELIQHAWKNNIVLVSPTTLLSTLGTISLIWQQERQTRNVIEIANESGKLYDKFVNLLGDLEKVQNDFGRTQSSFDNVMKKLDGKGNLIRQVEKIKSLGANASKSIPVKYLEDDEEMESFEEAETLCIATGSNT